MASRKRHAGPGVTILVLLLACLAATVAQASVTRSGGFRYVTEAFKLKPGPAKTFRAPCPKRTHVLGGGHYNTGTFDEAIGVHSYPYDGKDPRKKPDDGWAAQMRAFGEKQRAFVYAVCAKLRPRYVRDELTVEPDGVAHSITVPCPAGTAPLSGGSKGRATAREVPQSAQPLSGWPLGLANHGFLASTVNVFAICSAGDVHVEIGSGTSAPAGQQTRTQVDCPAEAPHVIGGTLGSGAGATERWDTAVAATRPIAGAFSRFGSWEGWLDNYSSGSVFVGVNAICVPPL